MNSISETVAEVYDCRILASSKWWSQTAATARGFSLVEVLAAVSLIGILVFLALPNIVQVKQDSEEQLAIARREALDLAIGSYIQAVGTSSAKEAWKVTGATDPNEARYVLIKPYLAYAPAHLIESESGEGYMPAGYTATLPETIVPLSTKTQ